MSATMIDGEGVSHEITSIDGDASYLSVPDPKYDWAAKAERLHMQYKKLARKINYMNKLSNFGRGFGRNWRCPCGSGAKYKKCCLPNHEANARKVGQLQVAMSKLQARARRYEMGGIVRG